MIVASAEFSVDVASKVIGLVGARVTAKNSRAELAMPARRGSVIRKPAMRNGATASVSWAKPPSVLVSSRNLQNIAARTPMHTPIAKPRLGFEGIGRDRKQAAQHGDDHRHFPAVAPADRVAERSSADDADDGAKAVAQSPSDVAMIADRHDRARGAIGYESVQIEKGGAKLLDEFVQIVDELERPQRGLGALLDAIGGERQSFAGG